MLHRFDRIKAGFKAIGLKLAEGRRADERAAARLAAVRRLDRDRIRHRLAARRLDRAVPTVTVQAAISLAILVLVRAGQSPMQRFSAG